MFVIDLTNPATNQHFELKPSKRVNLLYGDSATGKTYFFHCLSLARKLSQTALWPNNLSKPTINDGKILVLNDLMQDTALRGLINLICTGRYSGHIICIDNADYFYTEFPELFDYIANDRSNYYVLAGRGNYGELKFNISNTFVAHRKDNSIIFKSIA